MRGEVESLEGRFFSSKSPSFEKSFYILHFLNLWIFLHPKIELQWPDLIYSSLREIDDRWSSGKGPMAMVFQPEEVKRLIRALFQNTDRRSQVLSRIKL